MIIYEDNREQDPLKFLIGKRVSKVIRKYLPFADYWASDTEDSNEYPIVWERKSLGDLYGTLTKGMNRFKAEIARCKDMDCTMYLGIEATMKQVYDGYEFSSVSGQKIMRTLMTLRVKYGVEPVFCESKHELKAHIVETYEAIERNYAKSHV